MKAERTIKLNKSLPVGYDIDKYFAECHNHEYYEFLYIIRGKAMNVMDVGVQVLERATLVAIRPDDEHFIQRIAVADEQSGKEMRFEFFNIPVPIEFMKSSTGNVKN